MTTPAGPDWWGLPDPHVERARRRRRNRRLLFAGGAALVLVLIGVATVLALTSAGGGASAADKKTEACVEAVADDRLTQALDVCSEAIELAPDRPLAYTYRAIANTNLGNYDDAVDDAQEALDLDPEAGDAYAVRARASLAEGDEDGSSDFAVRAAEAGPTTAAGHLMLAETYRALGRFEAAEDSAAEACDLGLIKACEFSSVPTREEAIDLLPQMSIRADDLPAHLILADTAVYPLEEEALRGGIEPASYRRQLESWGFVLGHERYFFADPSAGLFDVFCVVWLHEHEDEAEEAFLDGAFYGPGGEDEGEVTPLASFPRFGDESEAYLFTGPYAISPELSIDADSYLTVIRRGPIMALLTATWPAGQGSERDFRGYAEVLAERISGDPPTD